jgi:hypothetical protein
MLSELPTVLTTMTFPEPMSSIGPGFSDGIYGTCSLVAFPFVRLLVEATKNRTLEDMSQNAKAVS